MKIATVVGARPNFIKQAMVSRVLREKYKEILIHTGQHYDFELDRIFFDQLEAPLPNYNLRVGSGSHAEQTAEALIRIEKVLIKEKPDWVLLYGDVNSTLAGALAASKLQIPVAHVEAGLRANNKKYPEEINRVFTDYVSSLLFAPTKQAVLNLEIENITTGVYNSGDVMYDAVLKYGKVAEKNSKILEDHDLTPGEFIVATIHRAGTTNNCKKLSSLIEAFKRIGEQIIFPLHPRTEKALRKYNLMVNKKNINFIKPVSYLDMLQLVKTARMIITDSGGLQKEAYFLKTPCITCLEEDVWPETTAAKANRLVGTETEKILEAYSKSYESIKDAEEFGDGQAAQKIVSILEKGN